MRTYLAVSVAVAVLTGVLFGSGCVSRVEYDKSLAACRRANDELKNTQQVLRDAREQNQKLTEQMNDTETALRSRQEQLKVMESANADLSARLEGLVARYRKLLESRQHLPGLPALPEVVDRALKDFANANPALVEYLPEYGMVKLKADLTFELGSDFVQLPAKEALGKFVQIINQEAAAEFNIYVAGHTDDVRIGSETRRRHPSNWYLSVHRAVAVQQVLIKAGLAPTRIGAMGFGEYHPVAPNAPGKAVPHWNRQACGKIVELDKLRCHTGPGAGTAPGPMF